MPTRCCSPPDSSLGLRSQYNFGSKSTDFNSSSCFFRRSLRSTPSCSNTIVIFSPTVKFGNKLAVCNTYPVFSLSLRKLYSFIGLSFRRICPFVGSISRLNIFSNVVFPLPLGPTKTKISPFFIKY